MKATNHTNLPVELYQKPFPSARTGAIFNTFAYATKISPEAIALFIASHTRPGAKVLDTFAGSGTAGLATLLCDKPTEEMVRLATQMGISPDWGPRHAVLYEVGTLGSFVAGVMCHPPEPATFEKAAIDLVAKARALVPGLYDAVDPQCNRGQLRHIIWTDVIRCAECGQEIAFWDAAVRTNPVALVDQFSCPKCGSNQIIADCERVIEKVYDPFLKKDVEQKKRIPARAYGQTSGKKWQRPATLTDGGDANHFDEAILSSVPFTEVKWGELFRKGYHRGISHIHHFYTRRNFTALASLWKSIDAFPEEIQDALRLLVLSYNASHSTLMTRVVVKKDQQDFVLTGAQSGVLYVSSLPVEKNVFEGVSRKIRTLRNAFEIVYGSKSSVEVVNASSRKLQMESKSVDYVFTDPPFGDFIPYAELNQINEAWLGRMTDRTEEIIISPSQRKDVHAYEELMTQVFQEIARVLKSDGRATVVFHSARATVWRALTNSYLRAGLSVRASSILDKLQGTFKQVVSYVSVKGDPLLLLTKETVPFMQGANPEGQSEEIIRDLLTRLASEELPSAERTPERLFSRYVSSCLEKGIPVSVDAKDFYGRVRYTQGVQAISLREGRSVNHG